VTLFRCGGGWNPFPDALAALATEQTFDAKFALIGHHFERPEDIAFTNLGVSINNIEDWTIGGKFITDTKGDPNWTYQTPPERNATLANFRVSVRDAPTARYSAYREVRLTRDPHFRIDSDNAIPLEWMLDGPVLALHNLVAFGLGMPVALKWLRTTLAEDKHRKIVEIVFQADEPSTREVRHPNESLFTLLDLAEQFEDVLQRWFTLSERIEAVLALYFSALSGEATMSPQHQFLNLAQALEAYHRLSYGDGAHLPGGVFKAARDAFAAALPSELDQEVRSTALNKLDNRAILSARIRHLVANAPQPIKDRAIQDLELFGKRLRETRNYFTHWGKRSRWVATGLELLSLTEGARWLLEGLLLQELGLPSATIDALLLRNERLTRTGHWFAAY
jgi:hypothetical protein